nr:carboxyl transferase domain-containing protein [Jatrophihabitans sp. GAS493]
MDCDAVHPGYGFLSESAQFARACRAAGLVFIGPDASALELFGDKARARMLAGEQKIPVAAGSPADITFEDAGLFIQSLPAGRSAMLKAVSGGGGRGIRLISNLGELAEQWPRCRSEALAAFGSEALYIEEFLPSARHVEVQVLADATGAVSHLWDRDCSIQRRHQKLVEIAPSPWLGSELRNELLEAALALARASSYCNIGTFEFLIELGEDGVETGRWVFLEANPRLQVEHTVTEEVCGVDLVQTQLRLAAGSTLAQLGLTDPNRHRPEGYAIELRINAETIQPSGRSIAAAGRLRAFDPPSGQGIRLETLGFQGYDVSLAFDSLLAKLIVHSAGGGFDQALNRAYRALCEFRIDGVSTTVPLLQNLLKHPALSVGRIDTRFVEREVAALTAPGEHHARYPDVATGVTDELPDIAQSAPPGTVAITSDYPGVLVQLDLTEGQSIRRGQSLAVVEAMKMEQTLTADQDGVVVSVAVAIGDSIRSGQALAYLDPSFIAEVAMDAATTEVAGAMATALEHLAVRRLELDDVSRPEAVAKAERRGTHTARERVEMFCDPGSFIEFGGLVRAEGMGDRAPADGVITGTAAVDGRPVVLIVQDFSVFGGSVGHLGGAKMSRAIDLALLYGHPLVMLLDGGGHRIQDGQRSRAYAQAGNTFNQIARLSGFAPIVAGLLGPGFAANTNFSGMADFVVMRRKHATMGIAGPALVAAATGEVISSEELGGVDRQVDRQGLADLAVDTEEEVFAAIRSFLSYLPDNAGLPTPSRRPLDSDDDQQRAEVLPGLVPVNTRHAYDVRPVIEAIADLDSVFEIKPKYAQNLVTAFVRIGGESVGLLANQALYAGGQLDAAACEKAAHFIALCDAFGVPLVLLMDVPGFLVGPEAERTTLGRRSARMLFELGHATVPRISVVLRKGYGLGYIAMAGGNSFEADACLAWPTAEICAMSVEGSVDVAYRRDYESAPYPRARRAEIIASIREQVGPLQAAEGFGIDDLIDPRETRSRIKDILRRAPRRRTSRQPPKYRSISPI